MDSTVVNVVVESAITISGLPTSFDLTGIPAAVATNSVSYDVNTNSAGGYKVAVQSEDATLTPAGAPGNPDTIGIGLLLVKNAAGAFVPMSATVPVTIAQKTTRSAVGGDQNLPADFKITIPDVNEDTYSATLDFIATTL